MFSYGHHTITVPLPQSNSGKPHSLRFRPVLIARLFSPLPPPPPPCFSLFPPIIPQSLLPPSPYDLVKFYLEHPTSYHHEGFVKSHIVRSTGSEGESVETSLCRQVPVNIILLQNCHQHPVKVNAYEGLLCWSLSSYVRCPSVINSTSSTKCNFTARGLSHAFL